MGIQNDKIKNSIQDCIFKGMNNKEDIYTCVENELHVPRPTIRRVAFELKEELKQMISVLEMNKRDLPK